MPFCRICKFSAKEPNIEIPARSLNDSFVFCEPCKASAMKSTFSETQVATIEASEAMDAAESVIEDLSQGQPKKNFRILIWGPTPDAENPLAKKREELRRELRRQGHHAYFSEELVKPGRGPTNVQEAYQVLNIDLVINIAGSLGSTGEAHELMAGIGRSGLLWLNERAESAYAGTGLAQTMVYSGAKVEYYSDIFIKCCGLIKGSLAFVNGMIAVDNMADFYERQASQLRVRRRL